MDDFGKNRDKATETPEPPPEESSEYASSIRKMSEKWRLIRQQGDSSEPRGFFDRHFIPIGLAIGLFIIIILIIFGGFAFLVWNGR